MSSSAPPDTQTQPHSQPPPGGDIKLRSGDGVEFQVHTAILSMVSSGFQDMFTIGTAEKNSVKKPDILDHDTLRACLEAAHKYDLSAMLEDIDALLARSSFYSFSSSIDMRRISIEYDPDQTRVAAARTILTGQPNPINPEILVELARVYPPYKHLISLPGIQGAKLNVLAEVLLDFDLSHFLMLVDTENPMCLSIACHGCQNYIHDAL
ncbi:hypothetical protein FRC07_003292 [Ceratobasidium sp. 392]|nr:hypothetical protein FRC07_003292 [Ceratobasidium sp. 392]